MWFYVRVQSQGCVWQEAVRSAIPVAYGRLGTTGTRGSLQGAKEGGIDSQCPKEGFVPLSLQNRSLAPQLPFPLPVASSWHPGTGTGRWAG